MSEANVRRSLRLANCSGFYGDRLSAAREMVDGGEIDVLTGDYLAELTMLILAKARHRDPGAGFARTFLRQTEDVLADCIDRGIRIVTNAGGLAPRALREAIEAVAQAQGLACKVAHVQGDDLLPRLAELRTAGADLANLDTTEPFEAIGAPVSTANAYLGAWGIASALADGADVVVCPRVTDASLVVGPAAWWHGWGRDDLDALAGAVVAGHAIECGTQVTGGNFSSFTTIPDLVRPGFPIAEVEADGSCVITKHPGTGGAVDLGTVTAQLLYEIQGPRYAGPDVTTRFDSIALEEVGRDRVRITGAVGEPPPPDLKVCVSYEGGFRNSVTFALTGLDRDAKAELAIDGLMAAIGGPSAFDEVQVHRSQLAGPGQASETELLRVTVTDRDRERVGRAFSGAAIELALGSYPGFFLTAPPGDASAVGVYWPTLVPAELVQHEVVHHDQRVEAILPGDRTQPLARVSPPAARPARDWGEVRAVPLGRLFDARSGDKGGNANVGVWADRDDRWAWLREHLTVERLQRLLPDVADLAIERHVLDNLRALNFVVVGLLGRGVSETLRWDPQAKALGEWLRSREVEAPVSLLEDR
jgi:hypothetical protein